MSRFFSKKYASLTPYTPGEQPKGQTFIKLNTNESPFSPTENTIRMAREEAEKLELYSDPECTELVNIASSCYGIDKDEIIFTNGSDEVLNFAFMAFCDEEHPAAFPDITYGFYPVFAELNHIPYEEIPLKEDFTLNVKDYLGIRKTIFIANPNAPTGIFLNTSEIRRILEANPENVVVIDEAYVDFGGESCVPLIHEYPNLLVVQTFSKSRSMAGARLGMGIGCRELVRDLNTIKYATNPYNVNRMSMASGIGALKDDAIIRRQCRQIIENRRYTENALKDLGFEMTDSSANFIFVRSDRIKGEDLYLKLRQKGILVRHFSLERIKDYNRITIGSKEQMEILVKKIREILEETE